LHRCPQKSGSIQLNTPSARRPSADAYGLLHFLGVPDEGRRDIDRVDPCAKPLLAPL
jgi:hypothetical protein